MIVSGCSRSETDLKHKNYVHFYLYVSAYIKTIDDKKLVIEKAKIEEL